MKSYRATTIPTSKACTWEGPWGRVCVCVYTSVALKVVFILRITDWFKTFHPWLFFCFSKERILIPSSETLESS